jgi:protein required for attachment to host cells
MADQKSRGGKKQGNETQAGGKRHQGVRKGSTARRKERHQQAPRQRVVEDTILDRQAPPAREGPVGPVWVLVADASRARLFEARGEDPWRLIREFDHPEARLTGRELRAIEPGREQSPAAGHDLAIEKTPLPDREDERFAGELAEALKDGLNQHAFTEAAIVAPPEFLGRLRARLDRQVVQRVRRSLAKDYTGSPPAEVQERLAQVEA